MGNVRLVLELDEETDARIKDLAARKGQDAAAVVADAVELLDSVEEFDRTGLAVPGDEVDAWIDSWGTANELPRPQPRKVK